ncbi:integrase catalytic domain-containing protein [Trichonephila clavipes]|nr:integrase catalytic domain-containing protein [Trichonephila clavipes]
MFRQILINPDHRNLQRILWKDSVDGPVQTYKLNTVTYCNLYCTNTVTCAPYLAIRTIQQLARDEDEHYPLAASVTIRDIYMDDILTGSSDFQEFQKLQLELISLFKKAGMSLHKWCSNTPEILNSIPKEEQSWDFHCQSSDQKTIKTLGIIWSPQFDYFSFKTVVNCRESYTKREVLSIIARLFDPLGFLGPILTKAKLILQKLWVLKLEWDEPLSNPIAKEWNDFVSTLPVIQNIHVPRIVIGKGRIIIMDLPTPQQQHMVLYYMLNRSQKRMYLQDSCAANPVLHWFLHNFRNPSVKRSGQLDYSEVNEAELCLIKNLQASAFQEEIEFLAKSSFNSKKGKLFSLNPFLDGNQILRVGGRLQNSDLTYTSKAVHLEIVSDLTTDAFLATLKRFVARRGKCATISSDIAKNFVGANRELKRLHNLLKFPEEKLSSYLSSEGISWNFMPPRAPNFGGLWEAGVKSFKFYLKEM